MHRTLGMRCSPDKLEMVAQVCHPSTPEEEAGRSAPQGHSQGRGKFKASLCGRSCLKKQSSNWESSWLIYSFHLHLPVLAALADVTVKISRRVTRHSPRGKRRMLTTQSHFTDSGFCCLVFCTSQSWHCWYLDWWIPCPGSCCLHIVCLAFLESTWRQYLTLCQLWQPKCSRHYQISLGRGRITLSGTLFLLAPCWAVTDKLLSH